MSLNEALPAEPQPGRWISGTVPRLVVVTSWLSAMAAGSCAASGCHHIGPRGDFSVAYPHPGLMPTLGLGISRWNPRHRVALNVVGAGRVAGNSDVGALLFEAEYDRFFRRRDISEDGSSRHTTKEFAFVSRFGAGPVSGEASVMLETSLGLGAFEDTIHYDSDRGETNYYILGAALEAFVTRTYGVDTNAWLVGGRLSFALTGWSGPYPAE